MVTARRTHPGEECGERAAGVSRIPQSEPKLLQMMVQVFVHACAPFQRRDRAKDWVRMSRTMGFASLVELTHTLLQPLLFLPEVAGAHLQCLHRRAVARKRIVVCQKMTEVWPEDSAQKSALDDEFARGHLQGSTAMCHHLRSAHLSPLPL